VKTSSPLTALPRRSFLKTVLAAGAAPWFVPAHVLGANGQTTPSNKLTVGVIGVGAQGHGDMQSFLTQDDVRVTALCDVNRRNLDRARKTIATAYGKDEVKVFSDFRELNADPSLDIVLMALPVHWHSIPSLDAILHGKHIFHEKPMALTFEEGRRVRAAVKKKGVVFQFGTQQRSDLKFRWACELALNGRLGKIKEIQVCAPGGKPGPAYATQPVPDYVDWDRWVGPRARHGVPTSKTQTRQSREYRGVFPRNDSCWGIHHLDIAQWGNGADATGPNRIIGSGVFAKEGDHDAVQKWQVRYEYAGRAPLTFAHEGTPGFDHGIKFVGESDTVHVKRGTITTPNENLLRDPQNKYDTMPITLPISVHHTRNFLDAIRQKRRPFATSRPPFAPTRSASSASSPCNRAANFAGTRRPNVSSTTTPPTPHSNPAPPAAIGNCRLSDRAPVILRS
jgi:predicted dehydrogenase